MGIFSSKTVQQTPPPQPDKDKRSGNTIATTFLLTGLVTVFFTGYLLVTAGAVLAFEKRRVRTRWFLLWAATTFIIGALIAGSMTTWYGWMLAQIGLYKIIPTSAAPGTAFAVAADFRGHPIAALACTLIATAPLAFLTAAIFAQTRSFSRATRGQIEGPSHANQRPVGILDRRRMQRERARIAAGHYLPQLQITPPTLAELHAELAELDPDHTPPPDAELADLEHSATPSADDDATTDHSRWGQQLRAIATTARSHATAAIRTVRPPAGADTKTELATPEPPPLPPPPAAVNGNPFARNTTPPTPQPVAVESAPDPSPPVQEHIDTAVIDTDESSAANADAASIPEPAAAGADNTETAGPERATAVLEAPDDQPARTGTTSTHTDTAPAPDDLLNNTPDADQPSQPAVVAISLGRRLRQPAGGDTPTPTRTGRSRTILTATPKDTTQ